MKDYYKILEIPQGSSIEDIKQSYRRLAKQYHPDINKSPDAHQKFIEISEAYEVLMHQSTFKEQETPNTADYDYDAFIQAVREAAHQQARMRYEKFARQHEAFRESGLYDLALLLKYIGKAILPFFALGLIGLPIGVAISENSVQPLFYLFFFWVIGGVILFFILTNLKGYFKLGKFYYNFRKLASFYTQTNELATEECFYSKGLKANSRPYKVGLVKIKDIQLQNSGPLQHYAHYGRKEITVSFPRSRKAFIVHSITSAIKISTILFSLIFLPFDSFLWRIIFGIFIGWLLSMLVLLVTGTRSKSAYFFSYGCLIKIAIWLTTIILLSNFDFKYFNISTSEYIKVTIVILAFADAFIEQILKLSQRRFLFNPLLTYYKSLTARFNENYYLYLEIPIWTVIYPFVRWIF